LLLTPDVCCASVAGISWRNRDVGFIPESGINLRQPHDR